VRRSLHIAAKSFDAPENTLPAYKMAVDRGFGFECDIYRSKDGRLFTFHDPNLKRTTGVDMKFVPEVVTAEYVRAIRDAGFEFHAWTIDDPNLAREAFRRGVQTVTTNRAQYLQKH